MSSVIFVICNLFILMYADISTTLLYIYANIEEDTQKISGRTTKVTPPPPPQRP